MKKTFITTLALGAMLSLPLAFSDSKDDVTLPSVSSITSVGHVEEKAEMLNERSLRNVSSSTALIKLQAKGTALINERIRALDSNKAVILSNATLTTEQKNSIVTRLTSASTGLSIVKSSIASSTDASSTKALIATIYTRFRIYGIVIPQTRLEKRIYDLQNYSTTLSATFIKVQTKIDEAKAKGKDVTVWQKSLDDAKISVANDMNTLATLLPKATSLAPSDYGTSSKATIDTINSGIKSVLKDFNSIKKNLHKPAMMGNSSRKIVGNGSGAVSPLFGTSWIWMSAASGTQAVTVPSGNKFVLSFGEDNHVNSTTDCNIMNGSSKVEGNKLTFGPMAMTMMYCDGSQEGVYASLLSKVSSYAVNGTTLTLTLDNGVMVFVKK